MTIAKPDLRLPSRLQSTATAPWSVLISRRAEGSYEAKSAWMAGYIPANGHRSQYSPDSTSREGARNTWPENAGKEVDGLNEFISQYICCVQVDCRRAEFFSSIKYFL